MNEKVKQYLIEKEWAQADASDEELQKVLAEKLASGELPPAKFAELSKDEPSRAEQLLKGLAEDIKKGVAEAIQAALPKPDAEPAKPEPPAAQPIPIEDLKKELLDEVKKAIKADAPTVDDVMKGMQDSSDDPVYIRVKNRIENYDHTPTAAVFKVGPMRDKPITYMGKQLNKPTPRRNKMVAVWTKWTLMQQGFPFEKGLTDEERDILMWIFHKEPFYADPDRVEPRRLKDAERHALWTKGMDRWRRATKASLLDDATSGGQEAVPEFFDEEVIITPVLEGEVAPLVNMRDMPRGSQVQGWAMGNVTFAAATEGSAVSLFDATSFITDYSPSVYRAAGFIQVGRNFLEDAVPTVADEIRASYTRKHNEWLDRVIVAGNGTTEPQGILNASGTTDITAQNATTGPVHILDAINLLFGVSPEYQRNFPTEYLAYAMTWTTYKRFRSIQVDSTNDQRLVFGNEGLANSRLFDYKVALEQQGLSNSDAIFAQFQAYRLYRRQGLRLIYEDRGSTLVRANTVLIGADMRYAGQLERGGYAAVCDSLLA